MQVIRIDIQSGNEREWWLKSTLAPAFYKKASLVWGRPPAQGLQRISRKIETLAGSHAYTLLVLNLLHRTLRSKVLVYTGFLLLLLLFSWWLWFNPFHCLTVSYIYLMNHSHFQHVLFSPPLPPSPTGIFTLHFLLSCLLLCVWPAEFSKSTYSSVDGREGI